MERRECEQRSQTPVSTAVDAAAAAAAVAAAAATASAAASALSDVFELRPNRLQLQLHDCATS